MIVEGMQKVRPGAQVKAEQAPAAKPTVQPAAPAPAKPASGG